MILKKPYAFLVKHFKIIHALLLGSVIYLFFKTWNIVNFFSSYLNNQNIVRDLSEDYVNGIMTFLVVVILFLSGIIIYLLRYKKKPFFFYLYTVSVYVLVLISYFLATSIISGLEFTAQDLRVINIIRDIYWVLAVVQIPIIISCFMRAIGFDVKKFDFKKDLLDLGIESEDNEEYEVQVDIDKDEIKAQTKKRLVKLKYFYKENSFLIKVFLSAIIIVLALFIGKSFLSKEKIYKINETIDFSNYKFKVLDSYKTNVMSNGEKINTKNFYVITKVRYINKTNKSYSIDTSKIRLKYNDYESATPLTEVNDKLKEFGTNYYSQIIYEKETRDFVFIFEIPIEYYDTEEFSFRYLYDVTYTKNEANYNYKTIRITPKTFDDKVKNMDTKSLGEYLSFKGSLFGDSQIKINDIRFSDSFYYNIVSCNIGNCKKNTDVITASRNSKVDLTLMRVNYNIIFDTDTLGSNYNNVEFISKYGKIRYEVNGKEYEYKLSLVDKTPFQMYDYTYVEVTDRLLKADRIYLDFVIRDKSYTYIIKDKEEKVENKEEESA